MVEFNTCDSKCKAMELNNTIFKGKQIRVTEKNRRTPNYILSKSIIIVFYSKQKILINFIFNCKLILLISKFLDKILDYHAYLNDNINKNKYEQDIITPPVSLIGPMKARLITKKSFEPY